MSSRTSALAQANLAHRQIEVIVYYQEVAQGNLVLMHQARYGFAAEVHKCPWPGQQQLLAADLADANSGMALSVPEADRMKLGEVIQALEANVMAIARIRLAGVP